MSSDAMIVTNDRRAGAVVQSTASASSPNDLLRIAVERGDTAQIEKMMDLSLRWEAAQAKKAFTAAMAAAKADLGDVVIPHDATVDFKNKEGKRTYYTHTTLAAVMRRVTPILSKHGLSVGWVPVQDSKTREITVTTVITHVDGHSETGVSLTGSPDESGNKNKLQAMGSTTTYLSRYGVILALGLATEPWEDVDGQPPADKASTVASKSEGKPSVTGSQASSLAQPSSAARAASAIGRYSSIGVTMYALEAGLGKPSDEWEEPEFARLGAEWKRIGELAAKDRAAFAQSIFPLPEREPGEDG